jgi:hypothetical protein
MHSLESPIPDTIPLASAHKTRPISPAMFGLLPAVALALLAADAHAMKLDFLRFPRRALSSAEDHALSKRAPTSITNYTLPDTNYTYVFSSYRFSPNGITPSFFRYSLPLL